MSDPVNHPSHYNQITGLECIELVEMLPPLIASCVKYVWRAGAKGNELEDLNKALWYLDRAINTRLVWLVGYELEKYVQLWARLNAVEKEFSALQFVILWQLSHIRHVEDYARIPQHARKSLVALIAYRKAHEQAFIDVVITDLQIECEGSDAYCEELVAEARKRARLDGCEGRCTFRIFRENGQLFRKVSL